MTPLIELDHINCRTGKKYLLHDISWTVNTGEKWIVFGENGSGKTTLLSLIAGYKHYTSGNMRLFNETYHPEKILHYRKQIGWISTSFFNNVLYKEAVISIILTGKDGTLGASDYPSNHDLLRANKLLNIFNLKRKRDMPFYLLSKGEQQSVLLARAFMGEPRILLLDEADSGLDYMARLQLSIFLNTYSEKTSATLISVTHYPNEIPDYFNHCLLMQGGRIYQKGKIEDVFCSEVMQGFLDCPIEVKKQKNGYQFFCESKRRDGYVELWKS